MKSNKFIIFIIFFIACKAFSQVEANEMFHFSYIFKPGIYYLLNNSDIYDLPDFNAKIIGFINIHEKIEIVKDMHNEQKVEDVNSCWYKINYNNILGYIWGGNVAVETFIFDIDNNGINDFFQYRFSLVAANYHFYSNKDVVIYINNSKVNTDNLKKNESDVGTLDYGYTGCKVNIENDCLIIVLGEYSLISSIEYYFQMDKRGNIEYKNTIKIGEFFENGEWIIYK
jgi:hypothetical protein